MMLTVFIIAGYVLLLIPLFYMGYIMIRDLIKWEAYGAIAMFFSIIAGIIILLLCAYLLA